MGVVGAGFTGAAQTHRQAARQQVVRTLKDAPFCANCSGILAGVPSNSGRLEFDHSTGRIQERPR